MLLALVGVVVGLTLLLSIVLMLRYRPPPPDRAARLYAKFVKASGIAPRTGETPTVFADRARYESALPHDVVRSVTDTYLDARYGPPDPGLLGKLESQVTELSAR
jgi:hypothetical protein